MWLSTVYLAKSLSDPDKQVVRVHGVGTMEHLAVEFQLGLLQFDDPDFLALVKGENEENTRDIARLLAEKLGLEVEF